MKIKDFKKDFNLSPLKQSLVQLDYAKNYPSKKEQDRLMERFSDFHWERQNVLTVEGHQDRMGVLRHHANQLEERQNREISEYEHYRIRHLDGIKDNIKTSRERFFRRTELDRKKNMEEFGKNQERKPLYKIINDGVPTRY